LEEKRIKVNAEKLKKKINGVFLLDAETKHELCALVDEFSAISQVVNLLRGKIEELEKNENRA